MKLGRFAQIVQDWAMKHYFDQHCTLCGNSGVINTRGVHTAAGVHVGRLNWCICPNGMQLRAQVRTPVPPEPPPPSVRDTVRRTLRS